MVFKPAPSSMASSAEGGGVLQMGGDHTLVGESSLITAGSDSIIKVLTNFENVHLLNTSLTFQIIPPTLR